LKNKKFLIVIIFIVVIVVAAIVVNFLGYLSAKKYGEQLYAKNIRLNKQIDSLEMQIADLKIQQKIQQENFEKEKEELKKEVDEVNIIWGYAVGYLSNTNRKLITKELPKFADLTVQYAKEFNVNVYDLLTICQIENGFDLHTPGKAGEQGPAQLMKGTWNYYSKKFSYKETDFYKWECNYRVAICHYSKLLKHHKGNVKQSIYEYNGGPKGYLKKQCKVHFQKFQLANQKIAKLGLIK
jgi:soluble lytic murein transglycosylase-like protein